MSAIVVTSVGHGMTVDRDGDRVVVHLADASIRLHDEEAHELLDRLTAALEGAE